MACGKSNVTWYKDFKEMRAARSGNSKHEIELTEVPEEKKPAEKKQTRSRNKKEETNE